MPPKIQTKLDAAIAAGVEPSQVARSGRLVLKGPQGTVALANSRGVLSAAGKLYYERTGKQKPRIGWDAQ